MSLSNKFYNNLKFAIMVLIPGIGAIAFVLSLLFTISNVKYLLGSLMIVILLIGILLYVSSRQYKTKNDGEIIISRGDNGKTVFTLELEIDPDDIRDRDSILFKVTDEAD